jgi:sulfite exporter TauE/SafE
MCGPLAVAAAAAAPARPLSVPLAYNAGRIVTYVLLGALSGAVGHGILLVAAQRWLSLLAGLLMLAGLAGVARLAAAPAVARAVGLLKSSLAPLLARGTPRSLFLLGTLNGLLPCGLAYAACVVAAATGNAWKGAVHNLAFGLGTLPMMLAIALAGARMPFARRLRLGRIVPWGVGLVACLLILRGLPPGIWKPGAAADVADICPACR